MNDSRLEGTLVISDSAAPHSEYVSLIARGAAIVFAGTVISSGLRYLFHVLIARHVGVELFGLFSLGLAVFSVAGVIASLGMSQGVVRYVSLYHGAGDRRRVKGTISLAATLTVGGGIVVSLALIALAEVLATDVFHIPELTNVLRSFAVAIPFFALTAVLLSAIQALRIMRYRVYVRNLFEPLSRIALAVLAFLLGWTLSGAIFAFVVSIIAGTFLSILLYRKVFRPIVGDGVQPIFELRQLLAFCWPLLFATGFALVEAWVAIFALGYFSTPEAVGIYSAAYRTLLLVLGILLSFNTMFAPIISDLHHRGEKKKLESLFKMVAKWIFILSFPAIVLMIIFSQEILTIFGREFATGATTLVILSVGQLMYSATGPLGVMINMSGRSKLTLLNTVLHLLLQVGLCVVLIPQYGIIGAAVANTISKGVQRAIQLGQVRLILRMHPFRTEYLKPVAAGVASWLVLSLFKAYFPQNNDSVLFPILGSLIFLVIYGSMLYRLGFDEEDEMILQRLRSKLLV